MGSQLISVQQVEHSLSQMATEFEKVLPPSITPEAFVRICKTAISKSPILLECDPRSIFEAAMLCAQDNLIPDGREAAFVPFRGKCQYMPMVKGIMKRLKEHGDVTSITAICVFENDEFTFSQGDNPHIDHFPKLGKRGDMIGAYSIFKSGENILHREVMSKDEIDKVRAAGGNKKFSPWDSFYEEMARKTVVRRGAKYVIHSDKSNDILDRDNVFYDFENKPQKSGLAPPSVKHLELDKPTPEQSTEVQGEVEEPTPEPEAATADDIPTNPETVLSNIKDDVERAQDMDDINNARDANHEDIKNLPDTYKKAANELFTARIDELEMA